MSGGALWVSGNGAAGSLAVKGLTGPGGLWPLEGPKQMTSGAQGVGPRGSWSWGVQSIEGGGARGSTATLPPPPGVGEGPTESAKLGEVAKNRKFGCSTDEVVPWKME